MAKRPTNSIVVCCVHHVRKKGRRARWQQTHTYRALGEKTKNNKRLDGLWGGRESFNLISARPCSREEVRRTASPPSLTTAYTRSSTLTSHLHLRGWMDSVKLLTARTNRLSSLLFSYFPCGKFPIAGLAAIYAIRARSSTLPIACSYYSAGEMRRRDC